MSELRELRVQLSGAEVLFTDRSHGNLSTSAGEASERGLERRGELCRELGLQWLCAGPQSHSTRVQRVTSMERTGGEPVEQDADGHATALHAIGVMVLAADCLPIALACNGAVAVVHAGWRGLAAGVVEQGVGAIRELGSGPIEAVIGPCAGPCCYEVGSDVHAAFGRERATATIDLRAIAHQRLSAAGVDTVSDVSACTICDQRFFSHRRERERAGRQAVIAWLS